MAHAPRERVNTASVVAPRSIEKLQIIVFGRPFWYRSHVGVVAVMSSV